MSGATLPILYLAGAINGCTDAEANDWRSYLKKRYGGETLDPMRRDYRGKEAESVNEIVELDKVDIDDCDVFIANCPKPSWGTAMEIYYAWAARKPVVVIHPAEAPISPWVRYHSDAIVYSLDDAVKSAVALHVFGDTVRDE